MDTTVTWASLKKTAEDSTRPIPNDWYDVTVTKAEVVTASTGALMIKAVLAVTSGPHEGRPLFTNFVLSEGSGFALNMFFNNMAAFGLGDEFFAGLAGADANPEIGLQTVARTLVERSARAEVGTRTWQGQERNEIARFAPATNGGPVLPGKTSGPAVPVPGTAGPPVPTPGVDGPPTPSAPPVPSAQPASVTGVTAPPPPPTPTF